MDYNKKFLKYQKKYNELLQMRGGAGRPLNPNQMKISDALRKEGAQVTMNIGDVSNLMNGDYDLVHKYEPEIAALRIKQAKMEQLATWLNNTFPRFGAAPAVASTDIIGSAARIFNSGQKEDFMRLVEWLNDPADN